MLFFGRPLVAHNEGYKLRVYVQRLPDAAPPPQAAAGLTRGLHEASQRLP